MVVTLMVLYCYLIWQSVRDDQGSWHGGFSSYDGHRDVLFVELFAIFHSLSLLLQLGKDQAICKLNSRDSVVRLQEREHHTCHAYPSLLMKIASLMDSFKDLSIIHVYQEDNTSADFLVKLTNKNIWGISFWNSLTGLNVFLLLANAQAYSCFPFMCLLLCFPFLLCNQQKKKVAQQKIGRVQ